MNSKQPLFTLWIGIEPAVRERLQGLFPAIQVRDVAFNFEAISALPADNPVAIFCGLPPNGTSLNETGQVIRMQFPNCPLYLVASSRVHVERTELKKNGFSDIFFLPIDFGMVADQTDLAIRHANDEQAFKAVRLADLNAGDTLQFDTYIYLPANNKHVRYTAAGVPLEQQKIDRLKQRELVSLFVTEEDLPKFQRYTAQTMREVMGSTSLSETERSFKLQQMTREIVSDLMTESAGGPTALKKNLEQCQNLVRSYVAGGNRRNLYDRVAALESHADDTYSRWSHISTYAALFAIGMGIPAVDELALAGFLHDVGTALVPLDVMTKDPTQWTEAERAAYEKHPLHSVSILKDRGIDVPPLVTKIILQHHERYDGGGYPAKLKDKQLCTEAQILAFAGLFESMTAVTPGKPRLTPHQAVDLLRQKSLTGVDEFIDPFLLSSILGLFPKSSSSQAA